MGCPVNAEQGVYVLFISLPLLVVWVIAVIDVARQPRMTRRVKWLWVVSFSLIWPLLALYLLTRPVQGRFERRESRDYPHARLVDAALAHEDGRIDDVQMASLVRELRRK
jgi:ABC-type nickel/cobalt efflux system permease component RcnA